MLIMTTFANAAFATGIQPMEKPALELDGTAVRALAAALPAFAGKAPGSKLDDYIVHVNPAEDGLVQVVFEPRLPEGQPPTLGGSTPAGPEVNVWVRTEDYEVEKTSLAR
ncbi:hypothetical protein N791_02710 [Lysobacter defluvii IMMIB APB-9 = DSM 18482]|uniref:Uncharacterized protein n=1 Tax=Lysobacter defluvii IMMIB APB-9 = DSM 18482 TaxID=1385515 RepID=A0A0A0MBF4_9GAMM|nr:hypothetical protein N791_02710 [Lysobacter defluvii IMMIB APB-9 = DSM 18482]